MKKMVFSKVSKCGFILKFIYVKRVFIKIKFGIMTMCKYRNGKPVFNGVVSFLHVYELLFLLQTSQDFWCPVSPTGCGTIPINTQTFVFLTLSVGWKEVCGHFIWSVVEKGFYGPLFLLLYL